ncbi:helix-turn-helix transcriptional regulator [Erythrobacter sp. LQ02-29]|uniref:winged helix-turn-helix transcriptional regulator n=1 Tax=Erythrobacter sp. LQ02-29 TaxID=2920384 RepID=UPI001F4D9090|nr:helix-turn-helix domain-containing protein [Erythrobacter sp. LQ02-29]MCP9223776.1 helix-turn-helix transcriptional regulator [Erythrobacter sp. LQ02-29]
MKLQNVTDTSSRLHGKWYDDACGTAFGLELVGERWSLLIMRELMFGPRRFSDIRAGVPGISAKVLTERLTTLEANGVLTRRIVEETATVQVYELTEWGYAAEPVIQELGRWAVASPLHDTTLPLSAASFMMSLRTMFDARLALLFEARIGFRIGDEKFLANLSHGALSIARDRLDQAQAIFFAPEAPPLAALFYGGVPFEELEAQGAVEISGRRELALRFAEIFTLPDKVG